MKRRERPRLGTDARRAQEFRAELLARARAWTRGWSVHDAPGDFGAALFDVAARFSAQVAERLDRADEKLSLGMLDWLAVRGQAAKPARMPVVFKLADTARDPVLAPRAVQLQANVTGGSVVFETESDVNLVPGTLAQLVAVDAAADADAYYLPPPGIGGLDPLEARPDRWTLKSFAAVGSVQLQLDPATGIDAGTLLEADGRQYRVKAVEGDLVTVEPGIESAGGLAQGAVAARVGTFDPYGGSAHNWQEHGLYLGDKDALNIEAKATIEVIGAAKLRDATWQFFGKLPGDAEAAWHDMPLAAEPQPAGSVLLDKPHGSIDPTKIADGEPNRWIRAHLAKVEGTTPLLDIEELKLVVNRGHNLIACTIEGTKKDPGAQAEGFANATPLAFTSVFYPLGREPKPFDTFYLGCADAFSKKQAKVSICFELADASAKAYSTIGRGSYFNQLIASIGEDAALHLGFANSFTGAVTKFRERDPLQPPRPGADGAVLDGSPVALFKAAWRPPMWFGNPAGDEINFIAVSAGAAVWVWQENVPHKEKSGWKSYGTIPSSSANVQLTGLVYVEAGTPMLYAAFDGKLYSHFALNLLAGMPWQEVALSGAGTHPVVRSIGPVKTPVPNSHQWDATGLVAAIESGGVVRAYAIAPGSPTTATCTRLDATTEVRDGTVPTGVTVVTATAVPTVVSDTYFWEKKGAKNVLVAHRFVHAPASRTVVESTPGNDGPDDIVGESLDATVVGTNADPTVVAAGRKNSRSWLVRWTPFSGSGPIYTENELMDGSGPLGGAPTALTGRVIAPGERSEAWIARWQPERRFAENVTLGIGLVVDSLSLLGINDRLIVDDGTATPADAALVASYAGSANGRSLFALDPGAGVFDFGTSLGNPNLVVFSTAAQRTGTQQAGNKLAVDTLDTLTDTGDWIVLFDTGSVSFHKVTRAAGILTLNPVPTLSATNPTYIRGTALTARIAPFFDLSNSATSLITVDDLDGNVFDFGNTFDPSTQSGEAFRVDAGNHPRRIGLRRNWQAAPTNPAAVSFDATISGWVRQLGDSPSNPELIWEYWNGTSWAKLEIDGDETQDFTASGQLKFTVPSLLSPTDVAGKTNFWIRARLVAGDYGRENVSVTTVTNGNTSTQTVNRDTGDFHPPQVVAMRIRYALDSAVHPAEVRTQDSGSWRNQSDANRAPGARVEAFVPLSLLMARLAEQAVAAVIEETTVTDCGCDVATDATAAGGARDDAPAAASTEAGLALLLGFDVGPLGEQVNVLLLVEERALDGFAPITVEALIGDRFEKLTARDGTRALGESGIVSMVLPVKPSPRDLFGRTLSWLRLRPSRNNPNAAWRPVIRGAYLNAVWASATETLTREPLGSSDGRPHLTVRVARPPLLQNTLELRVREPLDDEERKAMLNAETTADEDRRRVKYGLADLPGNWVLWKQVADPADCGPHERVYALDEALGEIRFGDGLHGMIPPIGRDAIVAFTYQRTEPPADGSDVAPANGVPARSKLNLVTPVESVEAAAAADHAAGGAPPENVARVQRFGNARLRHRGRALTLADFEDLALASSPDIVQARAFARAGGVRVVIVMRGAKPLPDAAQRRALRRELQAAASPLIAEHGRLVVEGARLRRLRLKLKLVVADLDDTGALANTVKHDLAGFFDSASGGVDGTGWPLGAAPGDDDIALALGETPALEGIARIERLQVGDDGQVRPWAAAVRADELVLLDDDPVRLDFATPEVAT